jgi:TM2 domain-containing membrane protein YozV
MGQQNDYYIIEEDDLLEPLRRGSKTATGTLRALETAPRRATRGGGLRPGGRFSAPIASTFSMFLCGAGQMVNGQWRLGLLLFLTEAFAVAAHWCVIRSWPFFRDIAHIYAISEEELFLGLAAADFLLLFFLLYNIAQAYHQGETRSGVFEGIGVSYVSAMASALVPGWGQLLNGQVGKGLFFLFCALGEIYAATLLILTSFFRLFPKLGMEKLVETRGEIVGLAFFFFATVIWVLSVYDAFLVGRYATRSTRGR